MQAMRPVDRALAKLPDLLPDLEALSCSGSTSWSRTRATSGGRTGTITSAADGLQIHLFGRGAHGSMPQASIDPVVMAAATVMRLQTIVARELSPNEAAVVTVGSLQAGAKANVIPDEAIIKLSVRTYDAGVRKRVLAAIPPAAISDWRYLATSLLAGGLTFFWHAGIERLHSPVLVFDGGGLALFAVAGTQKALAFGP